jgi:hypothetical protein
MRAGDLAASYPTVTLTTPAEEAARLLAGADLPGLIVLDGRSWPSTILPGTQVLRMAVPTYCQEDPSLARVVDEAAADVFMRGLQGRTVQDCLPRERGERRELPVVDPDATVLEVASLMARLHSPLVAVVAEDGGLLGGITLDALMDRLLNS